MAAVPPLFSNPLQDDHRTGSRNGQPDRAASREPLESRLAFRGALTRYRATRLAPIRLAPGFPPEAERTPAAVSIPDISAFLDDPAAVEKVAARVPNSSRLAVSLFAVTESSSMSLAALTYALGILGTDATTAIVPLLELGLVVIE